MEDLLHVYSRTKNISEWLVQQIDAAGALTRSGVEVSNIKQAITRTGIRYNRITPAQNCDCVAESGRKTECAIEYLIVEKIGVVENSAAAADDCLSLSPWIPDKTCLWRKVSGRPMHEAGEIGTKLGKLIRPAQIVVCDVTVEVVTQTKINRESRHCLP